MFVVKNLLNAVVFFFSPSTLYSEFKPLLSNMLCDKFSGNLHSGSAKTINVYNGEAEIQTDDG